MEKDGLQPDEVKTSESVDRRASVTSQHIPIDHTEKSRWDKMWPVIACGAGKKVAPFWSLQANKHNRTVL
jgi:hypothetical protein